MSLKGDKYENAEEVRFRLEGTVVMYDGEPVYISRVNMPEEEDRGEIARVFFYNLPLLVEGPNPETRKYLSSKKFDLATPKMGYFNDGGQATFAARAPVRQNRQGLCAENMSFTTCRGQLSENMTYNRMLRSKGFVDMIKGVYPSFKDAGDMLGDKNVSSVAISRSFAFIIDQDIDALFLIHRGIKCGVSMRGDKALRIPPKFHFLKEEMEEARIPLL